MPKQREASSIDPCQQVVYGWETRWKGWNTGNLTLPQCRSLVRSACEAFEVRYPTVSQHQTPAMSYFDPNRARISFRPDHKNAAIALHEAAHHIVWELYHDTVEDHGPEWFKVYISLLVTFGVAPEVALRATVLQAGLEWPDDLS